MSYGLVIFDNDGVLVDSERMSNLILAECLTEAGYPTSFDDSVRDFMGAAMHRVHDVVRERHGESLPEGFDAGYHERVFAAFEAELEPVAGVALVLDKLAADGVAYCLASSGGHERIRVALRKTGLYEKFGEQRIFSAQDVGRGKPAPDLFLYAARTMGVAPERCAVVEDSGLGVAAALAAGMDVYGYTAMTPAAKLKDATALFGCMTELPDLLLR
ncbi:HAD family hydrolase [Streptomyces sp. IBSBF 2435]|uniref:HAD family hydrolase n=1 Tax=Streptomyces sp. IBSBF 2435 TaxID=2903531 RepID=UPI002FDC71A9